MLDALELAIRIQAEAGRRLKREPRMKRGGDKGSRGRGRKGQKQTAKKAGSFLDEHGISWKQSSRWQKVGRIRARG